MCVFVSKKDQFPDSVLEISCYDKSSKKILGISVFTFQLCALLVEISRTNKLKEQLMTELLKQIYPVRTFIKQAH
jgi:D-alanyl-lipoteichoic acid acyltransferase DltB (MBOAT superfamily)